MRGDLLHLLLESLRGIENSRAAKRQSTASIGAASLRRGICVAVYDQHVLNGDSKLIGDDLRKRGLFSLAVWRRAAIDHHRAGFLNTHARTLIETKGGRAFGAKA